VRAARFRLEALEERTVPSTFVVDRLTDANPSGGEGSGMAGDLRYCLGQVADGDAVTFAVTGSINLTAWLPALNHDIRSDGPGPGLLSIRGPPQVASTWGRPSASPG
jgi:hypothetical protein